MRRKSIYTVTKKKVIENLSECFENTQTIFLKQLTFKNTQKLKMSDNADTEAHFF